MVVELHKLEALRERRPTLSSTIHRACGNTSRGDDASKVLGFQGGGNDGSD